MGSMFKLVLIGDSESEKFPANGIMIINWLSCRPTHLQKSISKIW